MDHRSTLEGIDFRQNPYKGVISEVAREEGVSQQAISDRVKRRNVRTMRLVIAKVRERQAVVREFGGLAEEVS